jgi:hypothetical protein
MGTKNHVPKRAGRRGTASHALGIGAVDESQDRETTQDIPEELAGGGLGATGGR